jgi:hypothetical protein
MSDRRDDDLDDFRESQEGDYEPDAVLHDADDATIEDDDDDRVVPDDDRPVPLDPDDTEIG